MSLVLAAVIAGGVALAGWVGYSTRRRRNRENAEPERAGAARSAGDAATRLATSGFTVEVGDVVSVRGEELWLERGWLLTEAGHPVAAVLFTSERTVVALPAPRAALYVVEDAEVDASGEPPASLLHDGARYERARRIPVELEPLGRAPDPPWNAAVLAEYRALDGTILFTLGASSAVRGWKGRRVDDHDFEHWGAGS